MVRTTLDLDGSVQEQLRRRSRAEGKSMGQLASELLAQALAEPAGQPREAPLAGWVTAHMGIPRVPLEDKDALNALLDAG